MRPEDLLARLEAGYEYDPMYEQLCNERDQLKAENAKLREALAISVPLPLDDNCCAVHPDDVIGYNVDGKDLFWKVKEMCLTRYPKKGQPVLWVVRTVNEEGRESPYVCWGGRCRAVHKVSAQTYSPEYLEVYDENKHLQAENAKLRDSLKALMMGTYAELCTDRDQPQCCECSMRRGDDTCVAADAMELLGIDMFGEPLGVKS